MKRILDLDPNEQILFSVKRHPIVVAQIIGVGAFVGIIFLVGLVMLVNVDGDSLPISKSLLGLLTFLVLGLALAATWIALWVNDENELIVTDQNVVQKLQFSLFSDRVSQLNLAKIQDVTVNKKGVLSQFLNYGTIDIESAGEQSNYSFRYAPEPNIVAKKIIEAHEEYVIERGRQSNDLTGDYHQHPTPQPPTHGHTPPSNPSQTPPPYNVPPVNPHGPGHDGI